MQRFNTFLRVHVFQVQNDYWNIFQGKTLLINR